MKFVFPRYTNYKTNYLHQCIVLKRTIARYRNENNRVSYFCIPLIFIPFPSLLILSSLPSNRILQVTDQARGDDAEGRWKEGWKLQDGVKNWWTPLHSTLPVHTIHPVILMPQNTHFNWQTSFAL